MSRVLIDDAVVVARIAVAVATRNIYTGEEISDNYGANHSIMDLEERQQFLMRSHWFTCRCEACTNNFPTFR